MPLESVNNFTSKIFNKLYSYQNENQNIAFSGLNLYILLAAIAAGLKGRIYYQLSQFLDEDFKELYDVDEWRHCRTAEKWFSLRRKAEEIYNMQSCMFTPALLSTYYIKIAVLLFDLRPITVNEWKPEIYSKKLNNWLSTRWQGSHHWVYRESDIKQNRMIFISTFHFHAVWATNFDPKQTTYEKFYLNNGIAINVEMMNQKSYNYIYEKSDDNFRILFQRMERQDLYSAIVLPKHGYMIQEILKNLNYVYLKLPKFTIRSQNDIVKTLKHFGITDFFDSNPSDFVSIINEPAFIGNITQFSNLVVNEGEEISGRTKKRVGASTSKKGRVRSALTNKNLKPTDIAPTSGIYP
ncbi:hypothetical protein RF11_15480 [Thelohanellus kitauei]|uniref:Serpin domain-containing protein n=1 Tax=Thelohanellus kitauei TaxID=669202 RepID=A0A0C2ICH6_THEKT|nr:hypothetical protein RF11_15480 [Thelohanellus kitauei]